MNEITGLRVTHKRAEISEIEELCKPETEDVLLDLVDNDDVDEAFVLQTCNRAEFYVSAETVERGREALERAGRDVGVRSGVAVESDHADSVEHLMRLATGLESMVVGEDEILGQMRDAYHTASELGCLGGSLGKATLKALHVGERARQETSINEGNASMGSAAAEVARRRLGSLEDVTVVVVGAGDMGELVARALAERDHPDEVYVANRTFASARRLADEVDGEAVRFSSLSRYIREADVVVTATSAPHMVFDASDFEGHDALVMDLANPRDVAPDADDVDGVSLVDIDDLSEVSEGGVERRLEAVDDVEEIISEEREVLEREFKRQRAAEMLSEIYERAEEIRLEETRRALNRLEAGTGVSEQEREVIDDLTTSLVNKLLSTPTEALKNAAVSEDYETLRSASEIFRVTQEELGNADS
ncbi:MAG: glutamyl-tRNA reductase [Halobacteriales archaeon]